MFLKYHYDLISPSWEIMEFLPLLVLQCSWCLLRCKLHIMPDFQPNEYLFKTHADKGAERWEIYAWAVRDAMMKAGHFESNDQPLKLKMQYEKYMRMEKGAPNPNGRVVETSPYLLRRRSFGSATVRPSPPPNYL